MTHCTVCTSVPKAVMMLGRATTTPNMPKAIVNCPGKIAAAVCHLSLEWRCGVSRLTCIQTLSIQGQNLIGIVFTSGCVLCFCYRHRLVLPLHVYEAARDIPGSNTFCVMSASHCRTIEK